MNLYDLKADKWVDEFDFIKGLVVAIPYTHISKEQIEATLRKGLIAEFSADDGCVRIRAV
jgi:hypothetical protein